MRKRRIRLGRLIVAIALLLISVFTLLYFLSFKSFSVFNKEKRLVNVERALKFTKINPIKVLIDEEEHKIIGEDNIDKVYEEKKDIALNRMNERRIDMLSAITKTDDDRKIAYLTFDDGPSKVSTPRILDILDKYDIKGTFFILGKNADYYPEILKDVYSRGHAIGNHSYTHDYKKMYKNKEAFIEELDTAQETLKKYLGEDFDTKLLRFPGGCFGQYKQELKKIALDERGFVSYNWNCLNGDAEGRLFSREHLFNRFKATAGGQKKLVVLMHDTDAKKTTPDALIDIIEYLKGQGYEFATLPEY